ncbi:MAG: 4-hydroxy-tetrahydrodipicolinate reductase, partial [Verrucomicrobiales bacterium]|nr:4-hydroxy-tetrahydrodipicolinate reductase [Verrucomicrobiales bacterium]
MSDPIKIIITGALGRMGQTIAECCTADPGAAIGAQIDQGDSLTDALDSGDAVIDFSFHGFTAELVDACLAAQKPIVMGTTGHTPEELEIIHSASTKLPIVFAPNYSVGVNTLFWLTRKACEILGPDFDLEVVEMHHRHKIDSPSGTAKRLAEILCEARELSYENDTRHGRFGNVGARTNSEIGVHALRGGD